jgi:PAS domain S-box-containing protein
MGNYRLLLIEIDIVFGKSIMWPKLFRLRSIKTRVTFFTLLIFIISIWSLAFFGSKILREEMQRLLGEQQFSTVSFMSEEVNHNLDERVRALELISKAINPALMTKTTEFKKFLDQRFVLHTQFNAGIVAFNSDGNQITTSHLSGDQQVRGQYPDISHITTTLKQGKVTVGEPQMDKYNSSPIFGIAVPIYDREKKIIGALAGLTNLGKQNFLDMISKNVYGKNGGFLLISRKSKVFVTASDKSRIMQPVPMLGTNKMHDLFMQGREEYGIGVSSRGVEELSAMKIIPLSNWLMVAVLNTQDAFAPILIMQKKMILITIFLTLVAGIVIWRILKIQFSPMLSALETLANLSNSKQQLHPLPIISDDEIGDLIGGFNRLLGTLEQQENALKSSESFLRSIINNEPECITIVDHAGILVQMNPAGLAMIGADHLENIVGKPVLGIVAPEYQEAYESMHQRVIAGESVQMKYQILGLKGVRRWLESHAVPLQDQGTIVYLAVTRDITDRKHFEEKLQLAASVFENSYEGIVITDINNKIINVNPAFTRITGYSRDEIIGLSPKSLASGKHDKIFYQQMWESLKINNFWSGEIWNRRKNGEIYPEMLSISRVKDHEGKLQNYIGIIADITSSKDYELKLKYAMEEAENANKAKSAFLASMSHEIRTPLNSVIGLTEMLLDSKLNEEQRKYAQVAHAAGENLLYLINDILDLSRIESGAMVLEKIPFFLSEQIENTVSIVNVRAREKNIQIKLNIDLKISNCVAGDPTRLRQVLLNLLANAVKFSDSGEISITVIKDPRTEYDDQLLFSVSDEGVGIPEDKIDVIFQDFQQVDVTITRRFGGSGLGLAISKKIIELMNGKIWVKSKVGNGSIFYFTIRLPAFSSHTEVLDEKKHHQIQTRMLEILLVEDSKDNQLLIQAYLKGLPHTLTFAENGIKAVEAFKTKKFDLVLMDVQMPVMDGHTATRCIRKWEIENGLDSTPIVALTANAFEEDVVASKNAGCTEHVAKPLKKVKLLALLDKYSS